MPTQEGLLTVEEAAEQLGLTATTIRSAIRQGKIQSKMLSRIRLIDPAELERYRTDHLGKGAWGKRQTRRQAEQPENTHE